MFVRFVMVAKASGICVTMVGATTFVGGMVMVTLTTGDVPRTPFASTATACNWLSRKVEDQMAE